MTKLKRLEQYDDNLSLFATANYGWETCYNDEHWGSTRSAKFFRFIRPILLQFLWHPICGTTDWRAPISGRLILFVVTGLQIYYSYKSYHCQTDYTKFILHKLYYPSCSPLWKRKNGLVSGMHKPKEVHVYNFQFMITVWLDQKTVCIWMYTFQR